MNRLSNLRIAAVLLAALWLLSGCGSKAERIASHLAQGDAYARQADWDKAGIEVRNVLQMDPKNAKAYYLGGQVEEGRREVQRAYGYYFKAVELDPAGADAKVGMARLYMLVGDDVKAAKIVAEVLGTQPAHLGAQTLDAALAARRGDTAEAIAHANRIIAAEERIPAEPSLLLAGLYSNQQQYAKALQVVETALKAEPRNTTLLAVAAQLSSAQTGDKALAAKAVDYYRAATTIAPKNADLWNAWALHHAGRNELDPAEKVLRDAMAAQPDDSRRALALLDFLANRRGATIAEAEYDRLIAARPKDMALRFGLVRLYRATHRPDDAEHVLREIVTLSGDAPSGLIARNQLAGDRLAAGRTTEARVLIEEVLKASPRDGTALLQRGRILLGAGDARNAILDLRSAVKDQPGSPEVVGLLAQAHRIAHEPELAREVLSDAVKFKPDDPELRLLLAADMADAGDRASAYEQLDDVIRKLPRDVRAYELKSRLQVSQKDTAGAEKTLLALQSQLPSEAIGYVRLGQLYADEKKFDQALAQYDQAAHVAPASPQPLVAAVGLLAAQNQRAAADARLDAMIRSQPQSVLAYQLKGELALAAKDWPVAQQSFQKVVQLAPAAPQGYQNLARVMAGRNDLAGALTVLEQGARADVHDLTTPALRADWLVKAGRTDDAIAAYEDLLARAPDNDAFVNNLAYLLTEAKGDSASLARALALAGRFAGSDNAGYLDSLGWVHYRLAHYDQAALLLERAARSAPDAALLQLHLGMTLCKRGDSPRGRDLIRKALQSKADLADADEARKLMAAG